MSRSWNVRWVPLKASSSEISTGCSSVGALARRAADAGAAGRAERPKSCSNRPPRSSDSTLKPPGRAVAVVVQVRGYWPARVPAAGGLGLIDLFPVVAPAVVLLALVGIRQDRVGLADLLKQGLGALVAGVDVGMVLARQLAIGGLELFFGGGAGNAEHRIVIASSVRRHALFLPES